METLDASAQIESMRRVVDAHGWDGDWFLRAYDDAGDKVGSADCAEGRIYIEPQGICVMAGLGVEDGRAVRALDACAERLETPHGLMLQDPPYSRYYLNLGEISSYPPGYKENAGIFCHNNPWIVLAEAEVGRGDRAFELYTKTCPAWREEISDLHRTEPYVYSQMIAGSAAAVPGEAKNSWLTGTAAWSYVAITQGILGIRADWDGLRVAPCIPQDWPGFRIRREYRGATYDITVENPDGVSKGVREIVVDGTPIEGNVIPAAEPGCTVQIRVRMG